MSDQFSDEPEPPPPTRADERAGERMAAAKPEIDHYVREVMRARVVAELFGTTTAVTVGRYELRRQVGRGGGGSVFVAWDPELTREVALKLIVAADPELRARALAEGQALARLSHPNVVPVFDVGVVDERVYLVMELIRGASLRSFAADARPREVIAAYRQCAKGLAAAHAAKLVHRDFKPDNAVMGSDGRVRVIDFGLAIDDRRDDGERRTVRAGTPRYMPPEQQRGEPLTAAADQYALAASMQEALSPVPKWLQRILARALADDPAERFASMDDLDAALARDPATRWRRRGLVALPVAVAIAGYGVGLARESGPEPCSGGAAELAATWTPVRRAEVVTHVESLGTPYARLAAARLATGADGYARRWIASHRAGCLAHRRGELSAEMYDRRQVCLASARTQLGALVELGGKTAADKIESLVRAIPELPDVARCEDVEALDAVAAPPQGQSAQVSGLRAQLDRARIRMQGGADGLETDLAAIVKDAGVLGYRPLLAEALLAQGTYYLWRWKYPQAEAPLQQAHVEALRSRDYRGAVEAFARLAWVLSKRGNASPLSALDGLAQIGPLAEGLPAYARFAQSLLHNNIGSIAVAAGDPARARAEFEAAIALAREVTGPGAIELSAALQGLALITDDADRRTRLFAQRIALLEGELGDAHPLTLTTQIAAALTRDAPADARGGLAGACHRLAELHPSLGAAVAECAFELGWLDIQVGEDARRDLELAMRAQPQGLYHDLAAGYLAATSGDHAAAERVFRALLADAAVDATTPWYARFDVARVEIGLGLAVEGAGKRDLARQAFQRARAHLEAAHQVHRWAPMAWRLLWLERRLR